MFSSGKIILLLLPLVFRNVHGVSVEELLAAIEEFNETVSNYEPAIDASIYFENLDNTTQEYGIYDFIIIGAGASGTVIANRLSEIYQWKILVLEAGDYGNQVTDIPAMTSITRNSFYDWGYKTVPQDAACLGLTNNSCSIARGRGVGGSSIINTIIYSRGSALDHDSIAEHVKDDTWSYENVLPYFKKSENFVHRDTESPVDWFYHGRGGYHNVEYHLPRNIFLESFLKANEELGWPVKDYNDESGLGGSSTQLSTRNGKRFDDGSAFIKPILYRKNLELLTYSFVTKILIDPETKEAQGVEFVHGGKTYTANSRMEVILCAGALSSPKLLMLSGVGPREHLESLDIAVIQNLEVGSKLRSHIGYSNLLFDTNVTLSTQTLEEQLEDYIQGFGVLTAADGLLSLANYPSKLRNGTENADIELTVRIPAPYDSYNFWIDTLNLHIKTTGTLRLKSNDPVDYPFIDPRFLTDKDNVDIKIVYESIQLALNLVNTDAFKKIDAKLADIRVVACSDYEDLSEEYWYCAIRQLGKGIHPVGTCPMGQDSTDSVVDSRGKVFGINKLRISDGSVFPFTISGHPHAQILMIAEKISDFIKSDYFVKNI